MLFRESLRTSLKELWANKVASLLNILAIVISITALNVMMAIMNGMERSMLLEMNQIGGLEKAVISATTTGAEGEIKSDQKRKFSVKDAAYLKEQMPNLRYAALNREVYAPVSYQGNERHYRVVGGTRDAMAIKKQRLAEGRPISDDDVVKRKQVCILGAPVQSFLGGHRTRLLGATVTLQGRPFEVIGVLAPDILIRDGTNLFAWQNEVIYAPITSLSNSTDPSSLEGEIHYTVRNVKDVSRVRAAMEKIMKNRGAGAVKIETAEAYYEQTRKTMNRMKINFSLIAGISLVVGGIGIMNIMLASVASRIKEIGIRQSIGATPRDIMTQFLIESMTVSFLGGLVGIVVSFIVVVGIGQFSKESPPYMGLESVLLSVIFSALVGLCFGIYPALKASKLDPIQALRYQ